MDDAFPKADSLVINDLGKIEAVGTEKNLRKQFNFFANEINFQGKTIIPGLNDAHIHIWKIGHLLTYMLDVRGVKSIVEFKEKLKDFASVHDNKFINIDIEYINI